jgi:hypothetical protein
LISIAVAAIALLVVHVALFIRCRPPASASSRSDNSRNV